MSWNADNLEEGELKPVDSTPVWGGEQSAGGWQVDEVKKTQDSKQGHDEIKENKDSNG